MMAKNIFKPCLNSFHIKLIALITMIIDHVGAIIFNDAQHMYLRMIGRISFPLYAFLLVEGYIHTRSVKKYLMRMLFIAGLSEPIYDYAFRGTFSYVKNQNILFELFLGLLMLAVIGGLEKKMILINEFLKVAVVILFAVAAAVFKADYSYAGILLIYALYKYRGNYFAILISLVFINCVIMTGIQYYGIFAIIPMILYNGEAGVKSMKYAFWAIYPLHLLVLAMI